MLGNHLHVILRLIDAASEGWWDGETVRRWGKLFPPRGKDRQALEVTYVWVEFRLKDAKWIAERRKRVNDLGWFLKRAVPAAHSELPFGGRSPLPLVAHLIRLMWTIRTAGTAGSDGEPRE